MSYNNTINPNNNLISKQHPNPTGSFTVVTPGRGGHTGTPRPVPANNNNVRTNNVQPVPVPSGALSNGRTVRTGAPTGTPHIGNVNSVITPK
jgi:hypothetical protein